MQAELTNLKPSINSMEEMLYVAFSALQSRVPLEMVQLDKDASPIERFQMYQNRDSDGRPFVMLQVVLHVDAAQLDAANHPWEKIIEVTSLSLPSVYKV